MAFVLHQIRPLGKGSFPWLVLSSNSVNQQECLTVDDARTYLTVNTRKSDGSQFVVVHNDEDRPDEAWALKQGVWRNLNLIVKHPLPGEWPYLYPPGTAVIRKVEESPM